MEMLRLPLSKAHLFKLSKNPNECTRFQNWYLLKMIASYHPPLYSLLWPILEKMPSTSKGSLTKVVVGKQPYLLRVTETSKGMWVPLHLTITSPPPLLWMSRPFGQEETTGISNSSHKRLIFYNLTRSLSKSSFLWLSHISQRFWDLSQERDRASSCCKVSKVTAWNQSNKRRKGKERETSSKVWCRMLLKSLTLNRTSTL